MGRDIEEKEEDQHRIEGADLDWEEAGSSYDKAKPAGRGAIV